MSKIFSSIYYSWLFFIVYILLRPHLNGVTPPVLEYVLFAFPFNLWNPPLWFHPLIGLLALFFCLFCVLIPHKYLKILCSVFVLLFISIEYSYGKVSHSRHVWMLSSVLMCFLSSDQTLKSKSNYVTLRLMQALILSHYFMSGLWKMRSLFLSKFEYSFKSIVQEYIAHGMAEGGQEINFILNIFLYKYPFLLSLGYFFVLGFQLSSLIPVFFNRFFVFYGVLAVLFHLSTGIVMGVYYVWTVPAVILFLIIAETLIKKEDQLKS